MIAATNGYDALVALFGALGVLGAAAGGMVAAWASLSARRRASEARDAAVSNRDEVQAVRESAERTEAEMKSPNGERTADAIYEMRKQLHGVVTGQSELKAGQQIALRRLDELESRQERMLAEQARHTADDDQRFGDVLRRLGDERDPE